MIKKPLVLLSTLLLSAAAFAEAKTISIDLSDSSLSFGVYGVVDGGFRYSDDNIDGSKGSRAAFDTGIQRPNRLGITSEADVNGWFNAGFIIERGFDGDTGADKSGWARQAYFYMAKDGYGKLAFGRQQLPIYYLGSETDPFAYNIDGGITNNYKFKSRASNVMSYTTPNLAGVVMTAGYTFNTDSDETTGNDDDISMAYFSPTYNYGAFNAGLNLQYYRAASSTNSLLDGSQIYVGDAFAWYDFGVLTLRGGFGIRNAQNYDFVLFTDGAGADTRQWLLGLTVPVWTGGTLMAAYTGRETDGYNGAADARAHQYSFGVRQKFTKHFQAYLTYSDIINNAAAKASYMAGGNMAGTINDGTSRTSGAGYQRGFDIGIVYSFDLKLTVQ